jgi:iron complex transport system ATP-binding protein
MNALEWEGLSVRYGDRQVLRSLSGRIAPGEKAALLGPNGSGKTTLLRALAGILPYEGSVKVDASESRLLRREELARRLAFLPQEEHWEFPFPVEEVVRCGRYARATSLYGESASDRAAIDAALRAVDLDPIRGRPVTAVSGGERRRAALARALAQEAPILLLDEPTTALDLEHRQAILRVFAAHRGTLLFATHDIEAAAAVCGRLFVLDRGRIAAEGAPGEVVTESMIAEVFRVRARVLRDGGRIHVVPEL